MNSVLTIQVGNQKFVISPQETPVQFTTRFLKQFSVDFMQASQVQLRLIQIIKSASMSNQFHPKHLALLEQIDSYPLKKCYNLLEFVNHQKSVQKENRINFIRMSQDLQESQECTFNPKIKACRSRSKNRFDMLYEHGKRQMLQRNKSQEKPDKQNIVDENCTFQPTISNKSRILSKNKSTILYQSEQKMDSNLMAMHSIFNKLDSDKDGIISRDAIDLQQLDSQIIQQSITFIFKRLLLELFVMIDEKDLRLNVDQFIQLAQPYYIKETKSLYIR